MSDLKPILFNTDMVRAILDGRKTVTRRVVKPKFRPDEASFCVVTNKHTGEFVHIEYWDEYEEVTRFMPEPYRPGDILYVRETWANHGSGYYYRADADERGGGAYYLEHRAGMTYESGVRWRPSLHMPREAARIWLRVTDVRVERLQDSFTKHGGTIFEIRAEGINIPEECRDCIDAYGSPCCIDTTEDDGSECGMLDYPRSDFADLWDSTIRSTDRERYGWAANPWVWVIEFERCERPEVEHGEEKAAD